ncbi:MAG: restriction endonuclease [Oscillospiraceae bacterium]|nr:restriction endonuclease [Oscillospiraceae bacterium]
MADECRRILSNANYINVDFSLKHRSGISNEPYGYNIGQVTAQKDDEKYTVGFELISPSNLPEDSGNALLKILATIMANIDLSDLDNRNFLIKKALMSEELILLNDEDFSLKNDILCLTCTVSSLSVSLQFYASNTKLRKVSMDFDSMEGHEFEFFCASLLKKNGYEHINVTRGSGDQGIDIIAYRDGIKYGIQCKCYSADIGNKAVQEVFAGKAFYECHVGVVLTNQYFTKAAIELAKKNGIILWDRKKLLSMIDISNSK